MINELKEKFSETGPSRLFEVEMKIKKLEIENDDFISCIWIILTHYLQKTITRKNYKINQN